MLSNFMKTNNVMARVVNLFLFKVEGVWPDKWKFQCLIIFACMHHAMTTLER